MRLRADTRRPDLSWAAANARIPASDNRHYVTRYGGVGLRLRKLRAWRSPAVDALGTAEAPRVVVVAGPLGARRGADHRGQPGGSAGLRHRRRPSGRTLGPPRVPPVTHCGARRVVVVAARLRASRDGLTRPCRARQARPLCSAASGAGLAREGGRPVGKAAPGGWWWWWWRPDWRAVGGAAPASSSARPGRQTARRRAAGGGGGGREHAGTCPASGAEPLAWRPPAPGLGASPRRSAAAGPRRPRRPRRAAGGGGGARTR